MKQEFEMSLIRELTFFLGLEVTQTLDWIFLCQSKFARNLIEKFGLSTTKVTRTPMSNSAKVNKDESGKSIDQSLLYRSMIGNRLYLTASHPDIAFSVGVCARYQADPKDSHLIAVKRIIKYVKSTMDFGV